MTYNATYVSSDASPMFIDLGLTILVSIGTLATVIGLLWAWKWFRKNKPNF